MKAQIQQINFPFNETVWTLQRNQRSPKHSNSFCESSLRMVRLHLTISGPVSLCGKWKDTFWCYFEYWISNLLLSYPCNLVCSKSYFLPPPLSLYKVCCAHETSYNIMKVFYQDVHLNYNVINSFYAKHMDRSKKYTHQHNLLNTIQF